ncbi:MAG: efflux RND transporter permease subunit, partial [Chitinophagaceae bacterium]
VVIGIPNSIYIIHKYHTVYEEIKIKKHAIRIALEQMGVVTFMCNFTTAIGFIIFAFMPSLLLHNFGLVTGISILLLFPVSIILILIFMSFLPPPQSKKKSYLHTNIFNKLIHKIVYLIEYKEKWIYIIASIIFGISIFGILKVKSNSYILDDLPKNEKVYNDLIFFDKNFGGVLPLEIIINTNKKNGAVNMEKLMQTDKLVRYLDSIPSVGQSLSIIRGLYFIRQAYYNNPEYYSLPNTFDFAFIQPYLRKKNEDSQLSNSLLFNRLLHQYVDSNKQALRISIMMKDIGTKRLDSFIYTLNQKIATIVDTQKTSILFTGTNILFQKSNEYLLKEMSRTIFLALLIVSFCIWIICKNIKITLFTIIPNLLSLMVVLALMGFLNIELKPANAIIFSIVYGISIDLTLRLMMSYLYENESLNNEKDRWKIVIQKTSLSIIFTALVLAGGFLMFCTSKLSNVFVLGGLTASVLIISAIFNLLVFGALLKHICIKK